MLGKMQSRATIWITGAFKTSPLFGIEAITGLIPIKLHLQKLSGRLQLQAHSLLSNYILHSLIEPRTCSSLNQHLSSLGLLTRCQCDLVKGPLVNMDSRFNKVFPFFAPLHPEFSPSHKVIEIFPSHFSFHLFSKQKDDSFKTHIQQLDNLAIESLSTSSHALVIMDAGVKNNVATSISHMHIYNKPVIKTLHHIVNITSTETKLFTIRYGINQATSYNGVSKIIIVTDSIHTAKKIFNTVSNPYQVHISSILKEL